MKHQHLRGQGRQVWVARRHGRRVRIYCAGLRVLVDVWERFIADIENPLPYYPKSDAFNEPRNV